MPPSQLKKLKSTLRERGIIGNQQSKKQRKKNTQNRLSQQNKFDRQAALTEIREQLNPFEYKALAKNQKFEVTSQVANQLLVKSRGLIKGREEEIRRDAYYMDQLRKKKVGGILDRRFGENDPTLAPEEKMLQRFVREKQIRHKNNSVFALEDDNPPEQLTHMGRVLSLDSQALVDDFAETDLVLSDVEEFNTIEDRKSVKRSWLDDHEKENYAVEEEDGQPQRKKSKQEVMKELIAKSKIYKYERQAAKEENEDLREELDKNLSEVQSLLRGIPHISIIKAGNSPYLDTDSKNPTISSIKDDFDKKYDVRLREMIYDKRSQPTEKSMTEEEIAAQRARKLQELESSRLRRMEESIDNSGNEAEDRTNNAKLDDEDENFGFGTGIKVRPTNAELGIEDEDEFVIEHDLIASESETDNSAPDTSDLIDVVGSDESFIDGELLSPEHSPDTDNLCAEENLTDENQEVGFEIRYQCPQSHGELLDITRNIKLCDLPTFVRRIRVLHDPNLGSENKTKLANFSIALVDHVSYLANQKEKPPIAVLEILIRHIHSLAKSYPVEVANSFRKHLNDMNSLRVLSPITGDLIILTAIGTIFPTSDHFHQVVTPAVLNMARYLGLKEPVSLHDHVIGTYYITLCLQFQRFSKRYIPEVINFIQNTLCVLVPIKIPKVPTGFPYHKPKFTLRLRSYYGPVKKLGLFELISQTETEEGEEKEAIKSSLLEANLKLLDFAADIWKEKAAFIEVFQPSYYILQHLASTCLTRFPESIQATLLLKKSKLSRRPLELHHHRPLAIKTSIPKFEESFNPDRHYDPDKSRTELAKLKKEHKREKKDTIKELRKDARTYAIQDLKEKKERDAAHEKKFRRLVAEIQGEEGKEAKAYEREKEWRKKSKK
ncbi:putative nucleolar complex protein 14 [Golovinomyces cichoracearum]|uniref:Putative nucleolar complex protein 14 n=1 Tax=Golovinomyces cichoracearum TaxID=62708 RepID=A0A420IB01_9PEZI|nr:putative nucleolar complex protein 14 [Golovinomyces cichoracearum]